MTSFPKSSADVITEIADHLIQSEGLPPDTPRPTLADLETWHQDGKCPLEARVETERRLKLLLLDPNCLVSPGRACHSVPAEPGREYKVVINPAWSGHLGG